MNTSCTQTHRSLLEYRKRIWNWLNNVCALCFRSPSNMSSYYLRPVRHIGDRDDNDAENLHAALLIKRSTELDTILSLEFSSHGPCSCGEEGELFKTEVRTLRQSSNYEQWSGLREKIQAGIHVMLSPT